jgi:FHA domain
VRPEEHLTCDGEKADFIVDLSNVVKRDSLGGERVCDLNRFYALIEALVDFIHDDDVQICTIGDWSLVQRKSDLTEEEKRLVKRWRHRGLTEMYDDADPRILQLADAFPHLWVVSGDDYGDYHRVYSWLPDNRDRFLAAVPGGAGGVKVVRRIVPIKPEWQLSRKEEETLLKGAHLYDGRGGSRARTLLSRVWRCPDDDCAAFGPDTADGQPLPVYGNGVVRCPTHHTKLTDVGPNPPRIQLKVLVDGVTRARFMVRSGTETMVGRAPEGPDGVALRSSWLSDEAIRGISRTHVGLSWDGHRLTVRDLSSNGTRVREANARSAGELVGRGGRRRLRQGQVISLYDGVELVVSGREFVFREEPADDEPWDPTGPAATSPTSVHHL